MMDKKKYENFCVSEELPLFMQPWWLDIVAGSEWSVVMSEENDEVVAAIPYVYKRVMGFKLIQQPDFTQHLGPWITSSFENSKKSDSYKKKAMSQLIKALPKFHVYAQYWHHSMTNWLPFYWDGFQQTTRYTYRINQLDDLEKLWSNLQENIRRNIRKAKNKVKVTIDENPQFDALLKLVELTFSRQNERLPFSPKTFKRIDEQLAERGNRKIIIARDPGGRAHAGAYLVWDENCVYYLIGGGDPELRNSGAMSLCLWEGITFASQVSKAFDFEGSMIESIERYFRSFGSERTSYFSVHKTSSSFISVIFSILKGNSGARKLALRILGRL